MNLSNRHQIAGALRSAAEAIAEPMAQELVEKLLPDIADAIEEVLGRPCKRPHGLRLVFSDDGVPEGKIGRHRHAEEEQTTPKSVITIRPKALEDEEYLEEVVKHELIHFLLQDEDTDGHDSMFQKVAKKLGLPKEYRD